MEDVEKANDSIFDHSVKNFGWQNINVSIKDRLDVKSRKVILKDIGGVVNAGEMMAIMGPSGSGKTTLLNVLAGRQEAGEESKAYIESAPASGSTVREVSAYVEQDDALCGGLTARETLTFAARLSRRQDCEEQVEVLLRKLGLQSEADKLIGTPIRKGMSGGQKRRVSIAEQLITQPGILFLDEPTSGLDSTSSWKIVKHLSDLAKDSGLIIIVAIHQPSSSVFKMFDKVLLLGKGETKYNKPMSGVREYLNACGVESDISEPEGLLNIANQDFPSENLDATQLLAAEVLGVDNTMINNELLIKVAGKLIVDPPSDKREGLPTVQRFLGRFFDSTVDDRPSALAVVQTLVHRSLIKSCRDILPYGIRIGMYVGLAIMMGTIWLRLATDQDNIQSFINAIFFGGAFMSFMAVAYIPAFLEDRALFVKERAHGLYGPASFLIANFITGVPYLFIFALLFSVIVYWLCNFRPTSEAFFTWIMWLFLDLLAAESLVVFVSSVYPVFVVALAVTAFANGLWMCTGGFLVPPQALNVFWRYLFHYIDYQSYVFQGMMVNEFGKRNFACARAHDNSCSCIYDTPLSEQCLVAGTGVLTKYSYQQGDSGKWVGIMIVIIFGYRGLAWAALKLRTK